MRRLRAPRLDAGRGRRPARGLDHESEFAPQPSSLALAVAATLQAQAPQTPAPAPPTPPAAQAPATPAEQPPVFRTGVEVLPIDVTVLDRDGRQVVDLDVERVPGRGRRPGRARCSRAEYIKLLDPMLAGQRRAARRQPGRAVVAGRHRHLEQRRQRRAAGPRHPAAGRPGQHPLRVGPAADAERPQVRRSAAAERPPRAGRGAGARRARRLHHRPRQGARGDAARHRPATPRRRGASTSRSPRPTPSTARATRCSSRR